MHGRRIYQGPAGWKLRQAGSPAEPSCFWEAFGDGCGSELEVDGQRQTDPADEPPEALLPKRRTHPDLGREHIDRMEEPEGEEWQPAPCHSPHRVILMNTLRERWPTSCAHHPGEVDVVLQPGPLGFRCPRSHRLSSRNSSGKRAGSLKANSDGDRAGLVQPTALGVALETGHRYLGTTIARPIR